MDASDDEGLGGPGGGEGGDLFRELLLLCEQELERTTEPGRTARLLHGCGVLYEERLGEGRRAAERYLEAYRILPGYLPNLRAARRLMTERADWTTVLELLDAELHVTSTTDQKAELCVERGRILEERLGAADRARQAYARALELDERNPDAWRLLARALGAAEMWPELDDLYARIAGHAGDHGVRAALLARRGAIQEERLDAPTTAAQLYEDALASDPSSSVAIVALKRLHARAGRWADLVAVLEREAELLDDVGKASCYYRIARIHADRLGRLEGAVEHLEKVERLVPDSALALSELAHLYEQAGRHHDLVRVSLRQLALSTDAVEKLALHHKVGSIFEDQLDNEARAMEHYWAAVELRPGYVPALQALGKLCRKQGAWEQLLEMHRVEAEQAPEAQRRALAHYRAGEVLETQLGRLEEAVEQYQRAHNVSPAFVPALRALDRLYSRLGRWKELISLYELEGESFRGRQGGQGGGEDGLRLARIEQIGVLYEDKIGDLDQAAESFRRVLEIEPSHVGAITALERIYEKGERWPELMEILEREAELVEDETWVAALLHKVGEVAEERLADRDLALLHYRQVLTISPSYVPALTSLGRMYYQQGRWADLLSMYRKEAEVAPRLEDRLPIYFKMGEIYDSREAKEDEAERCYRLCLELDPTFPPALRALERIYRRRREWERLAEVLEAQADQLRDPLARAVAHYRVGELWEERLGREKLAWDSYAKALECSRTFEPAREATARLCAARGDWVQLAQIYEEQLETAGRGYRRVELLAQLAALKEGRLEDVEGAVDAYEQVLEVRSGDMGALLGLLELYRRLGSWERLATCCRRLADRTSDLMVRAGALRELGLTLQDRLAPAKAASEAWEKVLEFRPTDGLALAALERSARSRKDYSALAHYIRLQIERTADPQVDAALRLALAVLLESAGRPADSLAELRKLLLIEPEHYVALEGARSLAAALGDGETEVRVLRQLAEVAGGPPRRAAMLVKAAELMEGLGHAPEDVAAVAEKALDLDPDSLPASEVLGRALSRAGEVARLRELLARAAGRGRDNSRMLALHLRVAALCREAPRDVPAAVKALERARKLSPEAPEVLDALAELYPELGRWHEALEAGERLLGLEAGEGLRARARLRQARLFDERVGDLAGAAEQLLEVLEADPTDAEALRHLGSVRARQKEWTEALVVLERLVEVEREPEQRVDALLLLAEVHVDGTGEADKAVEMLGRALALGARGEVVRDLLVDAFPPGSEPEALARALEAVLERADAAPASEVLEPLELELAHLLAGPLARGEEAVARYRAVLARNPSCVLARTRLAEIFEQSEDRLDDAIGQLRAVLATDPFRVETVRALARLWGRTGQPDRALLARSTLAALGAVGAEERDELEALARPEPSEPQRPLGRSALRPRLLPSTVPAAASALLDVLEPHLAKLHPPDLAHHGLSAGDAVPREGGTPLRRRAERVARLLDVPDFELYVSRKAGRPGSVEMAERPAVVLPAGVAELSPRAQCFVVGELLSRVALGTWVAWRLTPSELEILLAAATRIHVPGFGRGLTSEDSLEAMRKRVERVLPRRKRRPLAELARSHAERPATDYPAWTEALEAAGRRAGLLACTELRAALDVVKARSREIADLPAVTPEEVAAVLGESEAALDLLGWYLSDDHFVLRRMAGLDAKRSHDDRVPGP